mgnify:CR=1 FL=1
MRNENKSPVIVAINATENEFKILRLNPLIFKM